MTTISQAFRILVLTALPFVLLGATSDPLFLAPDNAVIIYNPGNGDFAGFRIVVDPSGDAWANDATGNAASRLPAALTQALFADIASIPIAMQPVRVCSAPAKGMAVTRIWLNGLTRDADAQQGPSADCAVDSRIAKLSDDAVLIQRALYVNSYRARSIDGSTPNLAGAGGAASGQGSIAGSVPVYREGSTYSMTRSVGQGNGTSYWTPNANVSGFAPYTSSGLGALSAVYGGAPVDFGNVNEFRNSAFGGANAFNGAFRTSMGFNQGGTLTMSGFSSAGLRGGFSLGNSFGH